MAKLRILFLMLLAGCTTHPRVGEPLRIVMEKEPVSLDPSLVEDGAGLQITSNLMDGLFGYDGSGKLENRMAESYSFSPDHKHYEFKIRKGARWSDGKPVSAEDFVTGLKRSLSPQTGAKTSQMISFLKSGGVTAEGDRLILELDRPAPYVIQALTLPGTFPQRSDVLQANGGKWPETGPSNGPYRMVSHQLGRKMILEKNPYYFGEASRQSSIEIWIVEDESTALSLFEKGEVDLIPRIPNLDLSRIKKTGVVQSFPWAATYFIAFNIQKSPSNDRDFRRAVAGSIQKKEIADLLGGGELPARSWIPEGLEGYLPYEPRSEVFRDSLERFKKSPQPSQPVVASFDSSARNQMIMEKIQRDLDQNLGVKISLVNQDWKTHIKSMHADASPIYRFGWLAPFMDPITFLLAFTTTNPNNNTHWGSRQYDRLVQEISELPPGEERSRKIFQAQAILVEMEAVVVPILHYAQSFAVSPRIEGFRASPSGVFRYDELRVKVNH